MRSGLIYKFCCVQCTSEYVGSTTRSLRTRVAEHAGVSFRTGAALTRPPHSSIREHVLSCTGSIDNIHLDNFTIIGQHNNSFSLRILESMFIFKLKPILNDMQSSHPLNVLGY